MQVTESGLWVRTFERGVERETLSCGTGVVASAYVRLLKMGAANGSLIVQTRGGALQVEVTDLESPVEQVWLTGPATFVFEGMLP